MFHFLGCSVMLVTLMASSLAQQHDPARIRSRISIYDLESHKITVLYSADVLWEAPNWSPDGKYLLANSGGDLYHIPLNSGLRPQPEKIALPAGYRCNNDHGISPDGKWIAFSASTQDNSASRVFVASITGENPRLLTQHSPSYFHGWSPDGKWLAFVGQRSNSFNIFRVPFTGGDEARLTSKPAYDDGPDYSPDGKWIYINSNRGGSWNIWRFPADGAGSQDKDIQQITNDALEDWFPHPSPDGKWIVFLSFPHGTEGHDARTNVQLRMISSSNGVPVASSPIQVLADIFGGQGTINVNSWSPDSKKFAFVSYEFLDK
jgi:TolB protein